jgi:hypothetical protein
MHHEKIGSDRIKKQGGRDCERENLQVKRKTVDLHPN